MLSVLLFRSSHIRRERLAQPPREAAPASDRHLLALALQAAPMRVAFALLCPMQTGVNAPNSLNSAARSGRVAKRFANGGGDDVARRAAPCGRWDARDGVRGGTWLQGGEPNTSC